MLKRQLMVLGIVTGFLTLATPVEAKPKNSYVGPIIKPKSPAPCCELSAEGTAMLAIGSGVGVIFVQNYWRRRKRQQEREAEQQRQARLRRDRERQAAERQQERERQEAQRRHQQREKQFDEAALTAYVDLFGPNSLQRLLMASDREEARQELRQRAREGRRPPPGSHQSP